MTLKKVKVLIVDDHEIFRNGVKQLINNENDMEVIGEASSGEEALQIVANLAPDVIIMDIRMQGMNGLDTSKQILNNHLSRTRILFFSLYDRDEYVVSALDMGAHGYILKDTSNKIFLSAIRAVSRGEYYFIGEVSDIIVKKYLASVGEKDAPKIFTNVSSISKREGEILSMIKSGMSNKDIADGFGISIRTIETHRLNILRKFNTNNFDEALEQAQNMGLLDDLN